MTKSATDLMQEIIFSAVLDSLAALKSASKGLPNNLLRDINSIHANTTFADLPKEVQSSISASVRSAFTRLLKEGYSVSTGQSTSPPRGAQVRREGPRHEQRGARPNAPNRPPSGRNGPSRNGPGGRTPPRGDGPARGPGRGPKPGTK